MRTCLSVALLTVLPAVSCVADPVPVTFTGGSIAPIDGEHPTVRLERERLVIEPLMLGSCVSAWCELVNDGPACDLQVGFPVIADGGPGYRMVRNLAVEVDGLPVRAESAGRSPLELDDRTRGCAWHTFELHFDEGQRRTLAIFYDEMPTHDRVIEQARVPYVLRTADAWAGTVEELVVEVDLGNPPGFHDVSCPGEPDADGEVFTWRLTDFDGEIDLLQVEAMRDSTQPEPGHRAMFARRTGPQTLRRPARVTVDGASIDDPGAAAIYRRGQMLLGESFLGAAFDCGVSVVDEACRCHVTRSPGSSHGGPDVQCDGWLLEVEPGVSEVFVPADEVLAEAGGAISVSAEAGELAARVTSVCYGAARTSEVALDAEQAAEVRETALRVASERWPETCRDTVAALLRAEAVEARTMLSALGHAEALGMPHDPADAVARLATDDREDEVAEAILHTGDDITLRAGYLALPHLDGSTVGWAIASGITEPWPYALNGMYARARNAGIALLALEPTVARWAVRVAEQHANADNEHRAEVVRKARYTVLAALDPEALVGEITGAERADHERRDAAAALVAAGSDEALTVAAGILASHPDPEVRRRVYDPPRRIVRGQGRSPRHMMRSLPEWARARPASEIADALVPLLEDASRRSTLPEGEDSAAALLNFLREQTALHAGATEG